VSAATQDAPARWDLEWQPERHAGRPERTPPSLDAAYAEWPLRALAFVLDLVLIYVLFQLLGQARSLLVLWITREDQATNDGALVTSGALLLLAVLGLSLLAVWGWRVLRATPGQQLLGLFVVERGSGLRLRRRAAFVRWLLLYAPLAALLGYTQLIDVLFRSRLLEASDPLLVASLAFFLPVAWYLVLGLSVLAERRRGRGLHDRLAGSVVVRRAGPPA